MLHLNDHLYTKHMCIFVGSEFLVSHCKLHTPRHFYGLSQLEICLTTTNGSFTRGVSIPTCYSPTQVFFITLFNRATLLDFIPLDQAHPIKHQTQCWFFNHALTPIQCDVPVHMQCNASLHATCIMNAIRTTQTTQLIMCHGQLS